MSGAALADSLALVIALAALSLGAHRLAARLTDEMAPRLIATVVLVAGAAVAEALILGLVGLGGSPGPLSALALLTGLAGWRLGSAVDPALQGPRRRWPGDRLERGSGVHGRAWPLMIVAGAALGALAGVLAIQLHRPVLGQDAITYHLPEVIGFVQSGHPGRVLHDFYGLPVGNYPITEEVLLAWFTGIAHGYAPLLVVTLATVPLLGLAGWLGLGELDVPAAVRALALAALLLVPLVVQAWSEPGTDLEAMTWLACCAALCLAARRHPGLLAPALVAAGLAIGTKTTVASWCVILLIATFWLQRRALAEHRRALAAALVLALGVGLTWYLRNWIQHGSPLWPFSSFPGGAPRPPIIDYLSTSLLQSLHATLLDHLHPYASALSGGVVVILGGILCGVPALALGRRRLVLASVVVLLGALEYAAGPVTGLPAHGGLLVSVVGSTLRYLMPVFAAGAVALALCAADSAPALRALGRLGLLGAIVWDLVSDIEAHFALAADTWLWVGLLIGALLGAVLARGRHLRREATTSRGRRSLAPGMDAGATTGPGRYAAAALAVAVALAAAVILALGSSRFSGSQAATRDFAQGVGVYLNAQSRYADTDVGVASSRTGMGQLAGNRLQHPLSVIPLHAGCAQVTALHRRDYLVIAIPPLADRSGILARIAPSGAVIDCILAARDVPSYDDGQYAVYTPIAPG